MGLLQTLSNLFGAKKKEEKKLQAPAQIKMPAAVPVPSPTPAPTPPPSVAKAIISPPEAAPITIKKPAPEPTKPKPPDQAPAKQKNLVFTTLGRAIMTDIYEPIKKFADTQWNKQSVPNKAIGAVTRGLLETANIIAPRYTQEEQNVIKKIYKNMELSPQEKKVVDQLNNETLFDVALSFAPVGKVKKLIPSPSNIKKSAEKPVKSLINKADELATVLKEHLKLRPKSATISVPEKKIINILRNYNVDKTLAQQIQNNEAIKGGNFFIQKMPDGTVKINISKGFTPVAIHNNYTPITRKAILAKIKLNKAAEEEAMRLAKEHSTPLKKLKVGGVEHIFVDDIKEVGKPMSLYKTEKMAKDAEQLAGYKPVKLNKKGVTPVPKEIFSLDKWQVGRPLERLRYSRETPQRVFEAAAPDLRTANVLNEYLPNYVAKQETNLVKELNDISRGIKENVIDQLNIKPNSPEDKAVKLFGEKAMTIEQLKEDFPQSWENVVKADQYFRQLYDDLLNRVNAAITQYGYDPVPKRKDYYTHAQELKNAYELIGDLIKGKTENFPVQLAGASADLKPGKQFFKYALKRMGNAPHIQSAIGSVESYLVPALRQIYMTEPIQRGRLLEQAIKDIVESNKDIVNKSDYNNLIGWLSDYVNLIAGKKTYLSRGTEALLGREGYTLLKSVQSQISRNLVGAKISAALTSFVPLTQSIATTDKKAVVKGLFDVVVNKFRWRDDYVIDGVQSGFLRRRFMPEKHYLTLWDKIGNSSMWLFETCDKFVSSLIVAAKYHEKLAAGYSKKQAMDLADKFAARAISDRSFGQMPLLFNDQGILNPLLQFQLEINNGLSFLLKDTKTLAKGDIKKQAEYIGQIIIFSYLYNNVFEMVTGQRPAFDPIGMTLQINEIMQSPITDEKQKASRIARVIVDSLPFVSAFTGGRIPLAAGVPSIEQMVDSPLKSAAKFAFVYGMPAGGSQLYNTIEGLAAYALGAETTPSKKVKFPIEQNIPNLLRSILFGKSSLPEAREYYKVGQSPLSDTQSQVLLSLKEDDQRKEYYQSIIDRREQNAILRNLENVDNITDKDVEKLSDKAQAILLASVASEFGDEAYLEALRRVHNGLKPAVRHIAYQPYNKNKINKIIRPNKQIKLKPITFKLNKVNYNTLFDKHKPIRLRTLSKKNWYNIKR